MNILTNSMLTDQNLSKDKTHKILWDFRFSFNLQEKITRHPVNFTISLYYRAKMKEGVKRDQYLDLARELKKL